MRVRSKKIVCYVKKTMKSEKTRRKQLRGGRELNKALEESERGKKTATKRVKKERGKYMREHVEVKLEEGEKERNDKG